MTAWGAYNIYDSACSNKQAEAVYFAIHHRLVIMTLGDEHENETIIVEIPETGSYIDPNVNAIGQLLKERFKTEYVTFHPFQKGEWIP